MSTALELRRKVRDLERKNRSLSVNDDICNVNIENLEHALAIALECILSEPPMGKDERDACVRDINEIVASRYITRRSKLREIRSNLEFIRSHHPACKAFMERLKGVVEGDGGRWMKPCHMGVSSFDCLLEFQERHFDSQDHRFLLFIVARDGDVELRYWDEHPSIINPSDVDLMGAWRWMNFGELK